jgi:DNA-binding Xre family transcriptional regulator
MDFATNLKRICAEKGTSPTRVCQDLGLSTSKVNLWNNGSLPKPDVLVRLAQHLECQVMDFFADDDYVENNGIELDEDEIDIIRLFRTLSRKEKHEFMSKAYTYEMTMMSRKDDK